MKFSAYLKLDGLNHSTLKHMATSPAHYRWHADHPDDPDAAPSAAMDFGNAVHCAVLEPDELPRRYVVWTGGAKRGKAWTEFKAAHTGRSILTEADRDRGLACADAVRRNPDARKYLTGPGMFEKTIQWESEEFGGLLCKARLDRVAVQVPNIGRVLVDLKTTRSLDPRRFATQATELGYHRQLAWYADGLAATHQPVDRVVMIVVETSPPFDSVVYVMGPDVLQAGRADYRDLLKRLVECREAGRWPGRFTGEEQFELPGWYFRQFEDDGSTASALGLTGLEQ